MDMIMLILERLLDNYMTSEEISLLETCTKL